MNDQVLKDYEEYKAQGRIWGGVPPERIAKIKFPRIDKKIIDGFLELEDLTGSISDVLDGLGIRGAIAASHLAPLLPGSKIAGTAITLRSVFERKTVTKGASFRHGPKAPRPLRGNAACKPSRLTVR